MNLLQDAVKVMAKSLIRNRHAVTKLHALKSQLQAVSLRIQVSASANHPVQQVLLVQPLLLLLVICLSASAGQ